MTLPLTQIPVPVATDAVSHTPGPWVAKLENGQFLSGGGNFLIANNRYEWVAECPIPIHNIPWSKDTAKANALLIAAAPDLLEIAIAYRNFLKTMACTEGEVATYNHVESIISKAKGES